MKEWIIAVGYFCFVVWMIFLGALLAIASEKSLSVWERAVDPFGLRTMWFWRPTPGDGETRALGIGFIFIGSLMLFLPLLWLFQVSSVQHP